MEDYQELCDYFAQDDNSWWQIQDLEMQQQLIEDSIYYDGNNALSILNELKRNLLDLTCASIKEAESIKSACSELAYNLSEQIKRINTK